MPATKTTRKTINIMTACDEGYAKLILPQLVSIQQHLGDYDVNFFLLHNRITPKTITILNDFSDKLRINFYPIFVDKNIDKYNLIASGGGVSNYAQQIFPYEVYFPLDCQNYLPDWVDRVLYIHSADIIFVNDVAEYYFSDFKGKLLTAEMANKLLIKEEKRGKIKLYTAKDRIEYIKKHGAGCSYFNSGSFMINVDGLRAEGRTLDDFIAIRELFIANSPHEESGKYYRGDQSFFAVAFLGNVNPFCDHTGQWASQREYNYAPYVKRSRYKKANCPPIDPKIIHFDSGAIKPWQLEPHFFESNIPPKVNEMNFFKGLHDFRLISVQEYFTIYWTFLKKTPIYDELLAEAQQFSKWVKKYYLPMLRLDMRHQQAFLKLEKEYEQVQSKLKAIVSGQDLH